MWKNRQVEDDERQLKRHTKADHKEQLHVDVVLQIGQRRSDSRGLADEPLKARRDDDEVAEDGTQEEQHRRDEHRGHNPLALVGAQCRQEKTARICQMIMGVHMTTAILMASEKRRPKPPSVVVM